MFDSRRWDINIIWPAAFSKSLYLCLNMLNYVWYTTDLTGSTLWALTEWRCERVSFLSSELFQWNKPEQSAGTIQNTSRKKTGAPHSWSPRQHLQSRGCQGANQLGDNLTTGMLVLCVAELHDLWINIRTWQQELQTPHNGNTGAFFCRCWMGETIYGRLIWMDGGIIPEWGFGGRQNGFEERKLWVVWWDVRM